MSDAQSIRRWEATKQCKNDIQWGKTLHREPFLYDVLTDPIVTTLMNRGAADPADL
jgi:hypothetical protein